MRTFICPKNDRKRGNFHDFDPYVIFEIWCQDTVCRSIYQSYKKADNFLPHTFMGCMKFI